MTPELFELLRQLVSEEDAVPKSGRHDFMTATSMDGFSVLGPSGSAVEIEITIAELEEMADAGFIRVTRRDRGDLNFHVTNKGRQIVLRGHQGSLGVDAASPSAHGALEADPVGKDSTTSRADVDPQKVFVIHGRNEQARRAMFDFLRALHLDPIEWSQAVHFTGKASPYVGEVLDAAFARARAVVALFTGDDEARLRTQFGGGQPDEPLTPQARPNVLFEAGMALGRHPNQTIFVELGQLRQFSDIGGRHVIRFDGSIKMRQEIARRLQAAGCAVDMSGTDWHDAGVFPGP